MTAAAMETLPCGCRIGDRVSEDGERQFLMEPCAESCQFYQYALRESKRRGKEVRRLVGETVL